MRKIVTAGTAALLSVALVACGGGEQTAQQETEQTAEQPAQKQAAATGGQQAAGELSVPDWMSVDHDAQTVTMDIVAGQTDANNHWNYNGYHSGNARIVVPEGYEVTINFTNQDDLSPHSLGIGAETSNFKPTYENPQPVFDGAITESADNMSESTQPGQSETITFTAGSAGEYAVICYLPGHATAGMWIYFDVSAEGEAGFTEL